MTVKEIETLKGKVFIILNSRTVSNDSKIEIFPVKPTDFLLEFDKEQRKYVGQFFVMWQAEKSTKLRAL